MHVALEASYYVRFYSAWLHLYVEPRPIPDNLESFIEGRDLRVAGEPDGRDSSGIERCNRAPLAVDRHIEVVVYIDSSIERRVYVDLDSFRPGCQCSLESGD